MAKIVGRVSTRTSTITQGRGKRRILAHNVQLVMADSNQDLSNAGKRIELRVSDGSDACARDTRGICGAPGLKDPHSEAG